MRIQAGLSQFRDALDAWKGGGEDFRIFPRGNKRDPGKKDRTSGELWFWMPYMDL